MRLFKYFTAETGLLVLRNMTLRLSLASELNDPFEFAPTVSADQFPPEWFIKKFSEPEYFEEAYRLEGIPKGFGRKRFKAQYLVKLRDRAGHAAARAQDAADTLKKQFASLFQDSWGLICGCTNQTHILMWSHYADEHRGLLIEFETDAFHFFDPAIRPYSVVYSKDRPSYSHFSGMSNTFVEMVRIARSKSIEWEYEGEYRIIFPRSFAGLVERRFLPIPPDAIKSVTFGCRASDATEGAVRSILGSSGGELRRAVQHESEYGLTIQPA